MERKELKKIPIDDAIKILHRHGINVNREEAEKILEFLSLLTHLILVECFDNQ
ncbi:hypothetical protein [Elizabethkingia anophelis]|uniref:hypothetical protein n=1 Tax=Elizabethkingia anophelis TaxID=1117645 RepID=UPI0021A8C319|nr:hypothetical protein [Elizabethkingia anophelis]MCT4058109.1 hypothetical protein [Elizabethkingia anophelis]MCT4068718.1 hypothetical protein [Elizabethkingia anophelis]